jgi:hypothetical protein
MYLLKPPRNNVVERVYSTKTNLNQFVNIRKERLVMPSQDVIGTTSAFYIKKKNNYDNKLQRTPMRFPCFKAYFL